MNDYVRLRKDVYENLIKKASETELWKNRYETLAKNTKKDNIVFDKHQHRTEGVDKRSKVYFIQDSNGYIKIGKSINPEKRVTSLNCASSSGLKLLATTIGGYRLEHTLHNALKECRVNGEWFEPSSKFYEIVESLGIKLN